MSTQHPSESHSESGHSLNFLSFPPPSNCSGRCIFPCFPLNQPLAFAHSSIPMWVRCIKMFPSLQNFYIFFSLALKMVLSAPISAEATPGAGKTPLGSVSSFGIFWSPPIWSSHPPAQSCLPAALLQALSPHPQPSA